MDHSGITKHRRKRRRYLASCVACHERKVKCNRKWPCESCKRRGVAQWCPGPVQGVAATNIIDIDASSSLSASSSSTGLNGPTDQPGGGPTAVENSRVDPKIGHSNMQLVPKSCETHPAVQALLVDKHGHSRVVRPWEFEEGEAEALTLAVSTKEHSLREAVAESRTAGLLNSLMPLAQHARYSVAQFLAMMPEESRREELLATCFSYTDSVVHCYHKPSVYAAMRGLASTSHDVAAMNTVAQVYAIMAIGDYYSSREHYIDYFILSKLALMQTPFMADTSLTTLSTMVLQACFLAQNHGSLRYARAAQTMMAIAYRSALTMGLDKRLSTWKLDAFHAELRTRMWWAIATFEMTISVGLGSNALCQMSDVVEAPCVSNCDDDDYGPGCERVPDRACAGLDTCCILNEMFRLAIGFRHGPHADKFHEMAAVSVRVQQCVDRVSGADAPLRVGVVHLEFINALLQTALHRRYVLQLVMDTPSEHFFESPYLFSARAVCTSFLSLVRLIEAAAAARGPVQACMNHMYHYARIALLNTVLVMKLQFRAQSLASFGVADRDFIAVVAYLARFEMLHANKVYAAFVKGPHAFTSLMMNHFDDVPRFDQANHHGGGGGGETPAAFLASPPKLDASGATDAAPFVDEFGVDYSWMVSFFHYDGIAEAMAEAERT